MAEGAFVAHWPCWACKVAFDFNPDTVPSLPIDPVTNLPVDLGGDPERAVRMPVCPACLVQANAQRVVYGLARFPPERGG